MLTHYISMHILLADAQVLSQTRTQTCGIQNRTGTDYLSLRQSADLGKYISQNINRIRYQNINCIGCIFSDLGAMDLMIPTLVCARSIRV